MVKKKIKQGWKRDKKMDTEEEHPVYSYGENAAASSATIKKKRVIKLTRKQKIRKSKLAERGEALADRRSKKQERDARKMDRKLAAKGLW